MPVQPPPYKPAPSRGPIRRRALLLPALVAVGILGLHVTPLAHLWDPAAMVALMGEIRSIWWTPLFLIGLYALMALFALPTAPLLMAGAVFGAAYGAFYNLAGLFCGAMISFFVARILGRDTVVRLTGRRMRRAEALLDRHGFWPLVQTRFMPLPAAIVNFGSGLAGVDPARFVAATLVGLIPSTLIHTFFMAELLIADAARRTVLLALYAAIFIAFNLVLSVLWVPRWRR